jgi:integrase
MPAQFTLSDAKCRAAKPKEKPWKLFDGAGLYLLIQPTNARLWRLKYRLGGKERVYAIGPYPEVGLAQARQMALEARAKVRSGVDPVSDRRESRIAAAEKVLTFEALFTAWLTKRANRVSAAHVETIERIMRRDLLPALGALPAASITPRTALACLEVIEARGALDMAYRSRLYASNAYDWGIAAEQVSSNPFAHLGKALTPKKVKHQPAMPAAEFPQFWQKLRTDYLMAPLTKAAMMLTVLTMTRTNETRFAQWSEIQGDLWVIPASRMKMARDHMVPITPDIAAVLDIARQLQSSDEWIFPQARNPLKPMSENAMLYALYRLGWHSRATMHGFRSLASTVLHETSGFDSQAIEIQLAHVDSNSVRAAYNRGTYLTHRRELVQWWCDWCWGRSPAPR